MTAPGPTKTRTGATLRATRVASKDERCPWCHEALAVGPELPTWRCPDCSTVSHVACASRCGTFGCDGEADAATAARHRQLTLAARPAEPEPGLLARLLTLGRQPLFRPRLPGPRAPERVRELEAIWRDESQPLSQRFLAAEDLARLGLFDSRLPTWLSGISFDRVALDGVASSQVRKRVLEAYAQVEANHERASALELWRVRLAPIATLIALLAGGLGLAAVSVAVFTTLGILETFAAALTVAAVTGLVILPRRLREHLARRGPTRTTENPEGDRRLELRRARRVRPGLGRSL